MTGLRVDGDGIAVEHPGGVVHARHVVLAIPAPLAAPLAEPIAPEASAALARITYGPFLSVAVETSETAAMPWDDVYAIATPGRAFDMFTNQAQALRDGRRRRPGGSLMLFAGAHGAAALSREPDDVIVDRFLADLHDLFGVSRGAIAGATVHRWEHGNVFARPGRHRLQAPLEGPLGPTGTLHLAGDYFAELGTMEAAARTGDLAARRIDEHLRAPVPPPTEVHSA